MEKTPKHPKHHQQLLIKLGSTIRQHRQQHNIKLKDLASSTTLSQSYLGQIERGERNPSLLTLLRIADAIFLPYQLLFESLKTPSNSA